MGELKPYRCIFLDEAGIPTGWIDLRVETDTEVVMLGTRWNRSIQPAPASRSVTVIGSSTCTRMTVDSAEPPHASAQPRPRGAFLCRKRRRLDGGLVWAPSAVPTIRPREWLRQPKRIRC